MKYKGFEIDILTTNLSEGVATIPLPDGSMEFISEEGATQEELEIIQQIKDDITNRPVIEPETTPTTPTLQEQVDALSAVVDMLLMGDITL